MKHLTEIILPVCIVLIAGAAITLWLLHKPDLEIDTREPGADDRPPVVIQEVDLTGRLEKGTGAPSELPGSWPGFRGGNLDNISTDPVPLARTWPEAGPKVIWSIEVGEGYAAPAVASGCVYLMDYNREKQEDTLRCLSLDTGEDIWRFCYGVKIKRNHGMSRTIPRIHGKYVVAIGPKNHVICLDAATGEKKWALDLVKDWDANIPDWYAGQCPVVDNGRVLLAVGGKALLMAVDIATGKPVWETPNPKEWLATHSSITPMVMGDARQYVYCANKGVVGVDAETGKLLWETTDWKIGIATIPSPVITGEGRIFLTGGYNAGSLSLKVSRDGDAWSAATEYKLKPSEFACRQQTPILSDGYLYGMGYKGKFMCLTPDGKIQWTSDRERFGKGYGPYLKVGNLFFIMDDQGHLTLAEATPSGFTKLASAAVFDHAHESWGPLVLVGGRLIVREMTHMTCLDVSEQGNPAAGH